MKEKCVGQNSDGSRCLSSCRKELCSVHKNQETCPICMEYIAPSQDAKLECGHAHHRKCILHLRTRGCPVCRAPLKSDKLPENFSETISERCDKDHRERNRIHPSIPMIQSHRLLTLIYSSVLDYIRKHPEISKFDAIERLGKLYSNSNVNLDGLVNIIYRDVSSMRSPLQRNEVENILRPLFS